MRSLLLTLLLSLTLPAWADAPIDLVRVLKKERTLQLVSKGKVQRSFRIALGGNPIGHKQREGDQRTPEGRYTIDYKKPDSAYYKALHISYPNADDVRRARRAGVPPGGAIMIHGQPNGKGKLAAITQRFDWTLGCVAMTDADLDVVWKAVKPGTPIELLP